MNELPKHPHRAVALLSPALATILLALLAACGDSGSDVRLSATPPAREDAPVSLGFDWPREVIVRSGSIDAAPVTFEATPKRLAVFYAVAGDVRFAASEPVAELVNDKGEVYETLSNVSIGAPEGVFLGILVTEPYKPGAPEVLLRIHSLTDKSGLTVPVELELPVATRTDADSPVDFVEGGRYGHDAGVRIADATVGVAGPPAPTRTHALVARDGRAASAFAGIDPSGVVRVITEDESGFKAQLPPDFPWPADVPY